MQARFFYTVLFLLFAMVAMSQKKASTPQRTPQQEAAKQTEMLARILPDLTEQQKRVLYDINLKYIKERQEQAERTATIERIKRKHLDYQAVLIRVQYEILKKQCENSRVHCQPAVHEQAAAVYTTQY
ncbi:MAG: hypothetical protein J6P99_02490 [Paludibacteraceae bacterium]|nr:hypothetical protein [Paludibacteraceae bacterium]